ncbi:homoserine dehydrogenase [Halalkalibacter urbisdiaboli]|uniref:homoserine dehydrogenase n=1 Tax=Halalkalibacter urbisdiaboli TaxID=1960589 RepID=UPI000B4511B2|nr:homoserine dehydrogenase [Halalkalibacter urbisdiaboli]
MLRIGLIGFGTVGSGVYERINRSSDVIKERLGEKCKVVAILVKDELKKREVKLEDALVTVDWEEFQQAGPFDIIFEAIGGIEPAFRYTSSFLEIGVPVITANKKLVAEHGHELEALAEHNDTYYGFEAAVAGGIPIINTLKGLLTTTGISRVSGILNGTTNYMLTEMIDNHRSFEDVLIEAQKLGYAEADPTDDVEGFDAWYKIRILSRLCFGTWPKANSFSCQGLSNLEDWHAEVGERIGLKLKLIGEAVYFNNGVKGSVSPAFLTKSEPLANVSGVTNGIALEGSDIDQLLLIGPGAGKEATANSMVEDFLFHTCYQGGRVSTAGELATEKPSSYTLLFVKQAEREEALQWVKDQFIQVVDTYSHPEGEAWLVPSVFDIAPHIPSYQVFGEIRRSYQSTQIGTF